MPYHALQAHLPAEALLLRYFLLQKYFSSTLSEKAPRETHNAGPDFRLISYHNV
jgi:hypothetical protein